MRKALKESLLKDLTTIYKAHNKIKGFVGKQAYENIQALLLACKSVALQMQFVIKESEGEECKAIAALEVYNNAVDKLLQNNLENCKGIKETLDEKLKNAENVMEQDIPVKLEIVFMPYKASMWDSLESVWLAAKEDENCDVYVIPIPYFERNPDGSFAKRYYEGNEYPEYVEIMDYQEYDFKHRHSDVIYIHNPYDADNFVSSVDPRFYSKELKKYTDKLVYIPYFVGMTTVLDHACCCRSFKNVDMIVVQSEQIKRQYESYGTRNVYALGSPKADAVINFNRETAKLPIEYKEKIGNKKIILYNTHLNGLINNGSGVLKKMKDTFDFFAKRDDVILWWRPHPLSESTLQSMNPEFFNAYIKVKENYIQNNIGIYDESSDLNLALGIADAYYGDASSLVGLFGCSGKPVMMQSVGCKAVPEKNATMLARCIDADFDGKKMWFFSKSFNSICTYEIEEGVCEVKAKIPYYTNHSKDAYSAVKYVNNDCVAFAPYKGNKFLIYNPIKEEILTFPVIYENTNVTEYGLKFCDIVKTGEKLFFIPLRYNYIVSYDLQTKKIDYCCDLLSVISRELGRIDEKNNIFVSGGACVSGQDIFMAYCQGNSVIKYNTKNRKVICKNIGNSEYKFSQIVTDMREGCFWILVSNASVLLWWNAKTNEVIEYELPEDAKTEHWEKAVKTEQEIHFCSKNGSKLISFHVEKKEWSVMQGNETPDESFDYPECKALLFRKVGDNIALMSMEDSVLKIMDSNKKILFEQKVLLPKQAEFFATPESLSLTEEDIKVFKNQVTYAESVFCSLSTFVDFVCTKKSDDKEIRAFAYREHFANNDGTSGIKIHEAVIKNML